MMLLESKGLFALLGLLGIDVQVHVSLGFSQFVGIPL